MAKVSIIIPAYNQARFLAAAIESALGQTHPDVETVVIDDGSTDNTPEVAGKFQARPSFKYVRQDNAGLPGARNRGVRESSGEYLCFLDSDDFYHPEKAARQAALLDANPDVAFVYCDVATVDENGQHVPEQDSISELPRQLSGDIFPALMMGGYFPPHAVMIRRSVLEAVGGFDPALGGHADYDLWLRVAGAGHRAVFQDVKLAFYRTHATSMSRDGAHMAETRRATFRKIARLYPDLVAEGLHALQQSNQDLFLSNQWLRQNWNDALEKAATLEPVAGDSDQQFLFTRKIDEARLLKGQPDQRAVWDVTLQGQSSKAIYLAPPAELSFDLPTAAAGQLITAVAIHPEVWDKADAGGCEFHVRIDGRAAFALAIDPAHLPGDRGWHEIKLHVPESARGPHRIILETRALGGKQDYRWALWRAPRFAWRSAAAPPDQFAPIRRAGLPQEAAVNPQAESATSCEAGGLKR
jgi:GT2 family glycosyltransferase